MTQPVVVEQRPASYATNWSLARFLMLVGAICFILSAIAAAGESFPPGGWHAWALGGVAALILARVAAAVV